MCIGFPSITTNYPALSTRGAGRVVFGQGCGGGAGATASIVYIAFHVVQLMFSSNCSALSCPLALLKLVQQQGSAISAR